MKNQYRSDIRDKRIRTSALIAILSLILFAYALAAKEDSIPLTKRVGCRECHKPVAPKIANLKQYRSFHQKPTAADKKLARDMAAEDARILAKLTR